MKQIDQLENNSVICFLGDSITANGIWQGEIFSYLVSHFKDKKLKLYNSAIRGDNSGACLKRVYRDCLCFSPDYVVLMLGMNDIGVGLYENDSAENLRLRRSHIETYKKNMTELMDIISDSQAKLILCTPTICGCIPNGRTDKGDFTKGLEACAEFIREQAEQRGCMLIDFCKTLWNYTKLQEPLISDDCVHPTKYGYHIMAQVFMVQMGMKDTVDSEPYVEMNMKNKERFRVEAVLANIRFCEYAMHWSKVEASKLTVEERKSWIREHATVENGPYWTEDVVEGYLKTADFRDDYTGELIALTNAMYLNKTL